MVFQSDHRDPTALSNREITALLEDHRGNICIGTTFGLNRYNPVLDQLQKYHFETRIISLYEDAQNKIWVGTAGDGLYQLDPESGIKHHYLAGENINDIYEDTRNEFWLATSQGSVNFDRASSSYRRYLSGWPLTPKEQNQHEAMSISGSDDGFLWIGMAPYGIMKIIPYENRDSIKLVHFKPGDQAAGGLCSYPVDHLRFDRHNNLWIGTQYGLNCFDPQGETSERYFFSTSDTCSVNDNVINVLFEDSSGTLWVGTNSGLNRKMETAVHGASSIGSFQAFSDQTSVDNQIILNILEDDHQNLWVGIYNGIGIPAEKRSWFSSVFIR